MKNFIPRLFRKVAVRKHLLAIGYWLFICGGGSHANGQAMVTATVTVTNQAGTTNGNTITVNGVVRTWTNNVTAANTQITTATNITLATSNLFAAYAATPAPSIILGRVSTNKVTFQGYPGTTMTVTFGGTWATVSYLTNNTSTNVPVYPVRVPKSAVTSPGEKTNIASGLITWISSNEATNQVPLTAPAFALFVPGGVGGGGSGVGTNYVTPTGTASYPDTLGTNFWWDMGLTNAYGPIVYRTITATQNVNFLGVTNSRQWGQLSINVVASGTNRLITVPTNLPHLNTNGLALMGSRYGIWLTNGNEYRITVQSNSTLSTLWTTFGQGFAGAASTNVIGATNSPTTGYSLHATGLDTKWYPDLGMTNSRTTGYIPYASGNDAYWGPPPAGGSGSALATLTQFAYTVATNDILIQYLFFPYFGNIKYSLTGAGTPPAGFQRVRFVVPSNGWSATNSNQIETWDLILRGISNNISIFFEGAANWNFLNESGPTFAPTNLAPNQIYYITIKHVGGQTNFTARYQTYTNTLVDN